MKLTKTEKEIISILIQNEINANKDYITSFKKGDEERNFWVKYNKELKKIKEKF